ncbi:MAG: hypothetical protein ACTSUY_01460, partial [Alphaproteobacteria bacterium]
MAKLHLIRPAILAILLAFVAIYLAPTPVGVEVVHAAKKIVAPNPPRPKPTEISDRATKPGLVLRATLGNGGTDLAGNLAWTINRVPKDPAKPAIEALGPAPFVALAKGRYSITVRADDATATGVADVVAGPAADFTLSLDAGRLAMQVFPSLGAMPVLSAKLKVLKGTTPIADFSANGKNVARILPSGKFTLETRAGTFLKRREIVITLGSTTHIVLDLDIGYLRAKAIATQDGEPLAGALFTLQRDTIDPTAKSPTIAMAGPAPVFVATAGRYRLVAQYGMAKTERIVAIKANGFSQITLDMQAGRIDARAQDLTAQANSKVEFVVSQRGGGKSEFVARYRGAPAIMHLPVGDYEIVARLGEAQTTKRSSVRPGEINKVGFRLDPKKLTKFMAALATNSPAEKAAGNG